jgi:hypothetical protein
VTDAEVTVKGNGDHDESRERDLGGDEEMIQLAHEVIIDVVACVLHKHGEWDDDLQINEKTF